MNDEYARVLSVLPVYERQLFRVFLKKLLTALCVTV